MKKYKILVENDSLSFKYNDLKLAEINSNSNNFQFPIKSKSYLFNDTSGFLFNSNNNSIVSTTDFFIDGTLIRRPARAILPTPMPQSRKKCRLVRSRSGFIA